MNQVNQMKMSFSYISLSYQTSFELLLSHFRYEYLKAHEKNWNICSILIIFAERKTITQYVWSQFSQNRMEIAQEKMDS